jgi:hypothetical protein
MTKTTLDLMHKIIIQEAKESTPHEFRAFFIGAIIGNVIGNMPDEYWHEFRKIEICDEPGCNCYELQAEVMKTLQLVRDDFKKITEQKIIP